METSIFVGVVALGATIASLGFAIDGIYVSRLEDLRQTLYERMLRCQDELKTLMPDANTMLREHGEVMELLIDLKDLNGQLKAVDDDLSVKGFSRELGSWFYPKVKLRRKPCFISVHPDGSVARSFLFSLLAFSLMLVIALILELNADYAHRDAVSGASDQAGKFFLYLESSYCKYASLVASLLIFWMVISLGSYARKWKMAKDSIKVREQRIWSDFTLYRDKFLAYSN